VSASWESIREPARRARVHFGGEFNAAALNHASSPLCLTSAGGHAIIIGH
jgi:hypothetical protein